MEFNLALQGLKFECHLQLIQPVRTDRILITHIHKNFGVCEFRGTTVRLNYQPTSMKNFPTTQSIKGLATGWRQG